MEVGMRKFFSDYFFNQRWAKNFNLWANMGIRWAIILPVLKLFYRLLLRQVHGAQRADPKNVG